MARRLSPYTLFIREIQSELAPDMKLSQIRKLPEVKKTWKCMQLQKKADKCSDEMTELEMLNMINTYTTPPQKLNHIDMPTRFL